MSSHGEKDPIIPAAAVEETMDTKIKNMAIKLAEQMAEEIAKEKVKKMMEENEKTLEEKILSRLMERMGMNKEDPPPSPTKASSSAKQEYHQAPFNYSQNSTPFVAPNISSSSLGKVPILEGSNYDEWANKMKYHLFGVHPSLWEIVNIGIQLPKEEDVLTPEWMQDLHRNAQAVSILLGSVSLEEYNKISGHGVAHEMWTTLRESHEGDSKSKKGMIEVLEGELGDFAMLKGETLQSLYDRLMV